MLPHQIVDGNGLAQLPALTANLAPLTQFISVNRPQHRAVCVNKIELQIHPQLIQRRFVHLAVQILTNGQRGVIGRRWRGRTAEPHVVNVVANGWIVGGG